ncbi:MAG: PLP-dependent aminotransferase family protein [Lachnospiraceae bacterium]
MEFQYSEDVKLLYIQVYEYFKKMILAGGLKPGGKMPSLRACSQQLGISRTTAENAYLLLAADGYIIAKAQSGYYVTDTAKSLKGDQREEVSGDSLDNVPILYDFTSAGVDRESFQFDLWRRYVKSALRADERLLSYGEPQGEKELREILVEWVRSMRNVLCEPESIVVGAGVQSLLHILCPLIREKHVVSFPTPDFRQGISVFEDYGFELTYRNKNADIIYVTPAHMTRWGEIMTVKRRLELVHYAQKRNSFIIEDDYENEFVYMQKPTPSLQSLSGGENVIYIGSFSRLLLPSIRISYMVLPPVLAERYRQRMHQYNQTASKIEQIALGQFIRDGHMIAQIRKLKRLYTNKMKALTNIIKTYFGDAAKIIVGEGGVHMLLVLQYCQNGDILVEFARKRGVKVDLVGTEKNQVKLLMSCSWLSVEEMDRGCRLLKEAWEEKK